MDCRRGRGGGRASTRRQGQGGAVTSWLWQKVCRPCLQRCERRLVSSGSEKGGVVVCGSGMHYRSDSTHCADCAHTLGDCCPPPRPLQEMGVAGLTRENVASHLQARALRQPGGGGVSLQDRQRDGDEGPSGSCDRRFEQQGRPRKPGRQQRLCAPACPPRPPPPPPRPAC